MKNKFNIRVSVVALCCVYSANVAVALDWDPLVDAASNVIAAYDGSTTNDLTVNSGRVDVMLDRSGNGHHLTDPIPGRSVNDKPDYHTSVINGLSAIYFDTYDGRFLSGITSIDCTNVCIVSVMMGANGDSPIGGRVYSTDGSDSLQVYESSNTSQGKGNAIVKVDNVACNTATANNVALAEWIPHIYAVWYDGSESAGRANGGVVSSANAAAPDGSTFTINNILYGRTSNTPRNYVGESLILNIADTDTIEKVEGYLAHKWTLYSSLPEDHPYRYSEPNAPIPFGALSVSNITTTSADLYVEAETNLTSATVVWDTSDKGTTSITDWVGTNSVSGIATAPGMLSGNATNLTADTKYFFRFYGEDGTTNDWSLVSSFASGLTAAQTPAFTAAPSTWNSVTLEWPDNAATETGYVLYRSTDGTSYSQLVALDSDTTSYVDGAVVHGSTYYYRLAATNSVNGSGTDPSACQTNATPALTGNMIFGENFEDPDVPAGTDQGAVSTLPTGWTTTDSNKTGLAEDGRKGATVSGVTGDQFAYVDDYPTGAANYDGALTTTSSILSSNLTAYLHYTLSCDVTGGSTSDDVTIDLIAGSTVVASVTKSIAAINNLSANTATIDFMPVTGHPNLGETLAIRLRMTAGNWDHPCYFDNLSLEAVDTSLDTDPPTPDQMTWVQTPEPAGDLSMLMTCSVASDANWVEYCFTNTVNGNNSGWIDVTTWRDTGLDNGVEYSYMVKARDKSFNHNETAWSSVASATADEGVFFYDSFELPVVSSATSTTDPYQWQDLSTGKLLRAGLGYMVGSGYTGMKGNQAAWLNVYNSTPILQTTTSNLDMKLVQGGVYTLTFLAADSSTYVLYGDLMAGDNVIMTASKAPSNKVFSSNTASNTVTVAAETLGIGEALSIRLRVTGGAWNHHSYIDDLRLYGVLPSPSGTLIIVR